MTGWQSFDLTSFSDQEVSAIAIVIKGTGSGTPGFKLLDARVIGTPAGNPTDTFYVSRRVLTCITRAWGTANTRLVRMLFWLFFVVIGSHLSSSPLPCGAASEEVGGRKEDYPRFSFAYGTLQVAQTLHSLPVAVKYPSLLRHDRTVETIPLAPPLPPPPLHVFFTPWVMFVLGSIALRVNIKCCAIIRPGDNTYMVQEGRVQDRPSAVRVMNLQEMQAGSYRPCHTQRYTKVVSKTCRALTPVAISREPNDPPHVYRLRCCSQ